MSATPEPVEFRIQRGMGAWYEELLRLRVEHLRANGSGGLPGDGLANTHHLLTYADGRAVGAGTVVAEPAPFGDTIR